jgi:hypothetical protein
VLAKSYGVRAREFGELPKVTFVPFTAQTRMSGVDLNGTSYRKGSADAIRGFVGGKLPEPVEKDVKLISSTGGTPLVVASRERVLGTIHLKDIVKGGLADRFERFRAMGIRTVMITGDNLLTPAAIAKEAGVDDFLAEAKPENPSLKPAPDDFLTIIRRQQLGKLKIYLGPCPGVGKTYQMLIEGNRLRRQGIDVVIGYVEPHDRPETTAKIGDLEIVPPLVAKYLEAAQKMGGLVISLKHEDVAQALISFAKEYGITHVILGRPGKKALRFFTKPLRYDQLMRELPGVDLVII